MRFPDFQLPPILELGVSECLANLEIFDGWNKGSVLAELTAGRRQTDDGAHPLGPGNWLSVAVDNSIYPSASLTRRSGVLRKSLGIERLARLLCGRGSGRGVGQTLG